MRTYIVPVDPISSNNAYPTNRAGHRFIDTRAVELKDYVKLCMEFYDRIYGSKFESECIQLGLWFLFPPKGLRFKNGSLRSRDVTGFVKLVEDAVSEYLGIDDKQNLDVHSHKRELTDDLGTPVVAILLEERRMDDLYMELSQWTKYLPTVRTLR